MTRFRVLQFNMQFSQIWDDIDPDHAPRDVEQTIAEIQRHQPDIFFLQEVEHAASPGARSPAPETYLRLKQAFPGYDSTFSLPRDDVRELPFGIGLAIFSRTALHQSMQRELPSPPIEFNFNGELKTPTDRLLIGVRTWIGGREVQLFNTHLLAFFMLRSSSEAHGGQRAIVEQLLRESQIPTLLAGDFNVSGHESLVAQFAAAGFATVQDREVTWRRRPYVLDHIFHSTHFRCLGHRVAPTLASDHHALVADFELD